MTYTAEMHTVGDVPMLTLTGPRGRRDLSQGQCASIVAMAEMHRNAQPAQPAQPTASDAAEAAVIVGAMDDAYRQECSIAQDEMAQHTRALHAILTAIRSGAIPLPEGVPQIAVLRANLADANWLRKSASEFADQWKQEAFRKTEQAKALSAQVDALMHMLDAAREKNDDAHAGQVDAISGLASNPSDQRAGASPAEKPDAAGSVSTAVVGPALGAK